MVEPDVVVPDVVVPDVVDVDVVVPDVVDHVVVHAGQSAGHVLVFSFDSHTPFQQRTEPSHAQLHTQISTLHLNS